MIPLRDTIPSRQAPVVTWALISVNVLVFLYELALPPERLGALFYLGIVPARYSHPEWAMAIDPITVEEAQQLGLNVRSDIGADILQLMTLYPQPIRRQPTVEYLPGQRHARRRGRPHDHRHRPLRAAGAYRLRRVPCPFPQDRARVS
jgi:hypothetical protein